MIRKRNLAGATLVLLSGVVISCGSQDKIESIEVNLPVHEETEAVQAPRQFKDNDSIIAYVIPTSSAQWFIKAAVWKSERSQVEKLLTTIENSLIIDDNTVDLISFDLASGWKKQKEQGMLHSKVFHPSLKSYLTISTASGSLLNNINRWNRQLGKPDILEADLSKVAAQKFVNKRLAIKVNLPLIQPELPKVATYSVAELSCELPEGWKALGPSGMRKLNLKAGTTEITAISLMARSQPLVNNVNRWARQIGHRMLTEEQILQQIRPIKIDGSVSKFIELKGPTLSISVAMLVKGNRMWFLKAMGPNAEITKNRKQFLEFLSSVKFKGGK